MPSRVAMSRFESPSATRAATSRCRPVRAGAARPREGRQAEEPSDRAGDAIGIPDVRQVGATRAHLQLGPRNALGEQASLGQRCGSIPVAMHDQRGRLDSPQGVSHVHFEGERQHLGRQLGRR